MNLLFDSNSIQVQQQTATGTRLNTLLGAISSAGTSLNDPWTVSFSTDPINSAQLENIDVLVILTRNPEAQFAYTTAELSAINSFVNNGGGLLLMTNHTVFSTNDANLAAQFGITLQPTFVSNPTVCNAAVNPMVMSNISPSACLNTALSDSLLYQTIALVAHDSCEIVPPSTFTSVATFPSTAVVNGQPPTNSNFAITVAAGSGNVIVVGNSGMVCDNGNTVPSCGLVPFGTNLLFFLDCIRYLAGSQLPLYPGLCPGQPSPCGPNAKK